MRTTAKTFVSLSQRQYSTSPSQILSYFESLGFQRGNLNGCYYGKGWTANGPVLESINPSTGELNAKVKSASYNDSLEAIKAAKEGYEYWKNVPAPKRGEIVRQIGERLRQNKEGLAGLIQLEVGKISQEGLGEVQEYVDVCDFAVGLSRSMQGKIVPSERPNHVLMEQYNPLGVVGVITAFNFPVAVYGWNAAIALVAGNSVVWKGAPSVPLTTMAVGKIMADVFEENNLPGSIVSTLVGGTEAGEAITKSNDVPLVSFTGSTAVGGKIQSVVRERWGQTLLELGGNNAFIVNHDADLNLALRAALFGAVGTAGQRCTSTRRLLLHESIYDEFLGKLVNAYKSIKIGDVISESGVLCGPLHSKAQIENYKNSIKAAREQGGKVVYGGNVLDRTGNFVEPTIIEVDPNAPVAQHETFAPILYVMKFKDLDNAITINNQTGYGLSSSLFTKDPEAIFRWMGPNGSTAGIVNVNIGNSGAEIGLPFGGNGKTGFGRECGGEAWKLYCRSSTCSINYGRDLPLAQGIKFDL